MALGGGRGLGGGKRKPKRQGIYPDMTGRAVVHDSEYMKALHAHRAAPVRVPGAPVGGPMELHHAPNPSGSLTRRDCDAAVVPLDRETHMFIEFHPDGPAAERAALPVFGEWSALHFWAHHRGLLDDPERGQKFLAWVIEQLRSEP